MIHYKQVKLIDRCNLSRYTVEMSIADKARLNLRYYEIKNEETTWNDLFEIFYNGTPVGYIKIYKNWQNKVATIQSLYIIPEYRKMGVATMSIFAIFFYVFTDLDFYKIDAVVYGFNTESLKVSKKYFITEGELKGDSLFCGKRYNTFLFAITKETFMIKYHIDGHKDYKGISGIWGGQ